MVTFRCTDPQHALFEKNAAAAGFAIGPYLRMREIGSPGPRSRRGNPSDLHKLLVQIRAELGKSGSNMNQTAKAHNELRNIAAVDGIDAGRLAEMDDLAAELRQAIADHRRTVAAVERALGLRLDDDHDY